MPSMGLVVSLRNRKIKYKNEIINYISNLLFNYTNYFKMWSCLSSLLPIILIWHFILFNMILSAKEDINKMDTTSICILDGNPLTNTFEIGKVFENIRFAAPIEYTIKPCIIDLYTCIIPLKLVGTDTICP